MSSPIITLVQLQADAMTFMQQKRLVGHIQNFNLLSAASNRHSRALFWKALLHSRDILSWTNPDELFKTLWWLMLQGPGSEAVIIHQSMIAPKPISLAGHLLRLQGVIVRLESGVQPCVYQDTWYFNVQCLDWRARMF